MEPPANPRLPERLRDRARRPSGTLVFLEGMINLWANIISGPPLRALPWKGEDPMSLKICWLDDLDKAQDAARKANKPILLDFYNPM